MACTEHNFQGLVPQASTQSCSGPFKKRAFLPGCPLRLLPWAHCDAPCQLLMLRTGLQFTSHSPTLSKCGTKVHPKCILIQNAICKQLDRLNRADRAAQDSEMVGKVREFSIQKSNWTPFFPYKICGFPWFPHNIPTTQPAEPWTSREVTSESAPSTWSTRWWTWRLFTARLSDLPILGFLPGLPTVAARVDWIMSLNELPNNETQIMSWLLPTSCGTNWMRAPDHVARRAWFWFYIYAEVKRFL